MVQRIGQAVDGTVHGDGELVELCMVMTLNLDSGAWCNGA